MEAIEQAIMAAAEAGKLRQYVRENGDAGLAGLKRLADRHSAAGKAALNQFAADAGRRTQAFAGVPTREA